MVNAGGRKRARELSVLECLGVVGVLRGIQFTIGDVAICGNPWQNTPADAGPRAESRLRDCRSPRKGAGDQAPEDVVDDIACAEHDAYKARRPKSPAAVLPARSKIPPLKMSPVAPACKPVTPTFLIWSQPGDSGQRGSSCVNAPGGVITAVGATNQGNGSSGVKAQENSVFRTNPGSGIALCKQQVRWMCTHKA